MVRSKLYIIHITIDHLFASNAPSSGGQSYKALYSYIVCSYKKNVLRDVGTPKELFGVSKGKVFIFERFRLKHVNCLFLLLLLILIVLFIVDENFFFRFIGL